MMVGQTLQRIRFLARALTLTATRRKLDVLDELESDHIRVELLFLLLRLSDDKKDREKIFQRIKKSLTLHARIEETIFYPACEKYKELSGKVAESLEEHRQMKRVLSEVTRLDSKDETSQARLKVLFEDVQHHVMEEERSFFPSVRRHMAESELKRLAERVRAARKRSVSKREKAPIKIAA